MNAVLHMPDDRTTDRQTDRKHLAWAVFPCAILAHLELDRGLGSGQRN